MVAAIARTAGKPHVLDSTKEPTRALFLSSTTRRRVIRLVRDPRSAVASHYWRLKEKGYYHFCGAIGACQAGTCVPRLGCAELDRGQPLGRAGDAPAPDRVLLVRYEDLRDRPALVLTRIGAALGLDLADSIARLEQGAPLGVQHIIGGNDVRLEAGLRFDPQKERKRPAAAALGRAAHRRLVLAADAALHASADARRRRLHPGLRRLAS